MTKNILYVIKFLPGSVSYRKKNHKTNQNVIELNKTVHLALCSLLVAKKGSLAIALTCYM